MNINEDAWNYAFLLKLNRNDQILLRFNQVINILKIMEKINVNKFHTIFKTIMGESWKHDINNVLMFLKKISMIDYKNINYKKNLIKLNQSYIQNINNELINTFIKSYYTDSVAQKQTKTYLFEKIIFENE